MPTSLTLFSRHPVPTSHFSSPPKDAEKEEEEHVETTSKTTTPIEVRKSCEFSHHTPACIKKATNNLNKLQRNLEEWKDYVRVEDEIAATTTEKTKPKELQSKLQSKPREYEGKLQCIRSGKTLQTYGDICSVSGSSHDDIEGDEGDDYDSEVMEIPRKCMSKVEGVRRLLTRFESDHVSMLKLLAKECERTGKLREMVDAAAYKRIQQLPVKVQEEHDKCILDIHELKWHFEYQRRIETRLAEEAKQGETLNKRLQCDVNTVKENQPLLEEKLELEGEAIKVIQQKQKQTDSALNSATDEMNRIEHEFESLKLKFSEEHRVMSQKVSSLSNELNANLQALISGRNENAKMKEDIVETHNEILEDEAKLKSEEKHLENLTEIGVFLKEKLDQCKTEISEQNELSVSLVGQIEQLKLDKEEHNTKLSEMRKRLEAQLTSSTKELRRMIMLNKKTKKEIQTIKKQIENCEKNRISNEKAAKRAVTELETIQDDLTSIKEQALDLKHLYVTLTMKLDQEQLKAAEVEEKLAEQSATLQKENKAESHARKILVARIKAESASFENKRNESEMKKQKILKTDEDLQSVIDDINQQIAKLSTKYDERVKTIEGLDRLLAQVKEKATIFYDTTNKELSLLQTKEDELKLTVSDIRSKQNHMETTTESINKKSDDMVASSIMMKRFLASNESAIEELQEEVAELQMQLDTANNLDEKLRKSLTEAESRSRDRSEKHSELMKTRHNTLNDIRKLLTKSLEENDMLATKYINLQYKHINQKNQFISTYEKNVIAEESLRDKESLCELHTRLHEALKCYYQLRGIQTKAGLSRFEDMTKASYAKLRYIQKELEKCIFNVCVFLKASKAQKAHDASSTEFTFLKPLPVS